jgi:UDP-N-acetylmuramate dehydrogenase
MVTWETFQKNKQLSEVTTLSIGGPARYYYPAKSISLLIDSVLFAKKHSIPCVVIGRGSNTLFEDRGFNGLVIRNEVSFLEQNEHLYRVGAGFSFAYLGVKTAREGWSGLEFASGIPASVGGAVYMNAGANQIETEGVVDSVEYLTESGELVSLPRSAIQFNYRYSSFQDWNGTIVAATFSLKRSSGARSKQLDIINYRKATQPYGVFSAGCIFRNPLNDSAGALIEKAGLKGKAIGGVHVSPIHANFIVNSGIGTFSELIELIKQIQKIVYQCSKVHLETELQYIPYDAESSGKLFFSV